MRRRDRLPQWVCVASVLVAVAALPCQAAARTTPTPGGASWSLSPLGRFQYTLAPGDKAIGAFDVVNGSADGLSLTLYAADMLSIAGGGFSPAAQGASMDAVGAWLHLDATAVAVPAKADRMIGFTLTVPVDEPPGQYDGAIVAEPAPVAAGHGSMGVATRAALTIQVSVPLASVRVRNGGETTLTAAGGTVTVRVPRGALPEGATLSLAPADSGAVPVFPALPRGATAVVSPMLLQAVTAGGAIAPGASSVLTVAVRLPVGMPVAGVFVLHFDPALHAWLPLPTDVRAGLARARLDQLGAIAVATDPSVSVYPDVAGAWVEAPVLALESLGVVSGYPDGTFRPRAPVTRAAFALMLQRALRLPAGKGSALAGFVYSARAPGWAVPALAAAIHAGLLPGGADGTLDPAGDLSRAQAAVIASQVLGLSGGASVAFTDAAAVPSWARPGVDAAVEAGLLRGYPDGSFRPLQPIARGEAAALIVRLLRRRLLP
jgi:hypothetical protein